MKRVLYTGDIALVRTRIVNVNDSLIGTETVGEDARRRK